MAEPSHRSTTSATPRSPVDVGRDADLLTSRDLEITRAWTNGNAGDSDGSGPSDQGVAPAARHRRARHAKVTGDDSPTVAFPALTPAATPAPEATDSPRPTVDAPTADPATRDGSIADGPVDQVAPDVADGWRILPPPGDTSHIADMSDPAVSDPAVSDTGLLDENRAERAPIAAPSVPEPARRSEAAHRAASPSATEPDTAAESDSLDLTPAAPAAIEVTGLHKRFGANVAVESVSFSVAKGSILALLGPNGAGKTTTVNMLCTLLKPDGGTATVAGHDVVSDAAGVRRSIMLTGQFAALDEALSGRDNLILFGRLMGLSKSAARVRADELLTSFDLTRAAGRRVGEYSGGMRRRIDIACGLVTQPEVVFLDEPTTGLDPRSRQEVWKLVESLRDQGVTTLLTTQYLEEADTLSDHIVVIDRGRVIASGTADELKAATGASHYDVTPADPEDLPRLRDCLGDLLTDSPSDPTSPRGPASPNGGADGESSASVAVPAPDGADTLVEIVQRTTGAGIRLSDVALRRPSLDEVFLALTDPSAPSSNPAAEPADDPA